jgi:HPt (histidine-containing phosphotransfer) domain-containing protein
VHPLDDAPRSTVSGENTAGQPHQAVLDPGALSALDELVGGDVEALHEIAQAFLEDAPERIGELRRGLAAGDDALVRRSAHTLKSTALTFGASELGEACRELEEAARVGRLDDAQQLAGRVDSEWSRARSAVEALLQ